MSSSKTCLTVDAVVQFLVSLLAALPSSSVQDPRNTLNAILIDVVWAVDVGLEDSLPSVSGKAELPPVVKAAYDNDRQMLASFANALVVRTFLPPHTQSSDCSNRFDQSSLLRCADKVSKLDSWD
jgi:hypothetical protein